MAAFLSFLGFITMIDDFWTGSEEPSGCYKLISVQNRAGSIVNFVITPETYFLDHEMVKVGDLVIGFYDANAPVPLIYPPRLQAVVMAKVKRGQSVKVDYFNSQLISSDGMLKLNLAPSTQILLEKVRLILKIPLIGT